MKKNNEFIVLSNSELEGINGGSVKKWVSGLVSAAKSYVKKCIDRGGLAVGDNGKVTGSISKDSVTVNYSVKL